MNSQHEAAILAVKRPAYEPPPGARAAASVLLVRDRPLQAAAAALVGVGDDSRAGSAATALEVLMLRRAEREGDMRGGAAVFPGGVLDARDPEAQACSTGPSDAQASALLGLAEGGMGYWVAAVRETFEEVGLLLAEREDGCALDLPALYPQRELLHNGSLSALDFCRTNRLRWKLDELVYCGHWLTPRTVPKRFDTRFFIAHAPAGQVAQADMGEAVELMWLTPAEALAPERGLKLMPVTRRTLQELARHTTAAQAVQAARQRQHEVELIEPRVAQNAQGRQVVLPGDWSWAEVGRLDPERNGNAFCDLVPGRVVQLSPCILRVTAPNPGTMTGPGTNSYLVAAPRLDAAAERHWTVIDPGPDDNAGGGAAAKVGVKTDAKAGVFGDSHLQALLVAAQHGGPGRITQILVTHTHRDHSPLAARLSAATSAPVLGRLALHPSWQDPHFAPQRQLQHGERLALGPGCTLRVLHTPGHASNHLCYLLEEEQTLFTGDHVMQGSTVVINPPDGDMVAYLAALEGLLQEPLQWLAPGHGFLVDNPHRVLRDLIAHRLRRHDKVAATLRVARTASLEQLVAVVYDDVPTGLHGMAKRSLLAHVLKLRHDGHAAPAGHDEEGAWSWL
jgi:glyoxylase-like metal-dependent hydrolase (beta-lactamase superfamily II)/8-oxo-dGTP pyrophosphatase MutT (NUDIX family)